MHIREQAPDTHAEPLAQELLGRIDAYWRAANEPSVGQIYRLTYRRTNHRNLHARGYKEEGTTTTPFDMTVLNDLDRYHLVMDVIDRLPGTGEAGLLVKQELHTKLLEHRRYIELHGEDMPEIFGWRWTLPSSGGTS